MALSLDAQKMEKMKRRILLTAALLAVFGLSAAAQDGLSTYFLPRTTLTLTVTVERVSHFAGPYARYADKYLGIEAEKEDAVRYEIRSLSVTPALEADPAARYAVPAKAKGAASRLMSLSSQGLVNLGAYGNTPLRWDYPADAQGDFSACGPASNLTSRSTTLYQNEPGDSAFVRVEVHQQMRVAKSADIRAEEAAEKLLELRDYRIDLLTGNIDGNFSGEALGAAARELAALEEEYLRLFTGYEIRQQQTVSFDVIPKSGSKGRDFQVAFRLSEAEGLLPADNLSGQPFMIEITPEEDVPADEASNPKQGEVLHVRVPAVCKVRITDGVRTYLQTRLPIAQKGQECLIPLK